MMFYRSRCKCKSCRYKWKTRKRKKYSAPAHCPNCFSTKTSVLSYWSVK